MKCHNTENWGVECDRLSENAPHKLVYLRIWSPDMELFRNAWVGSVFRRRYIPGVDIEMKQSDPLPLGSFLHT